jgi:LEM3-like protein
MLGCYVYRLIDPRNGVTFYVGRGRGDRVFSHAAGEEKPTDSEDADSLKIRLIRAIKADDFQVEHVIHRHGMNEEAAREVEAALIDVYPGLTNSQRGSDSQRGVMHATQVIHLYEAEEAKFQHHKVILFDVSHSVEDRPTIDAVEHMELFWHCSEKLYRGRMIDFLELASTRATQVLLFKSRLLHNNNLRSAFMVCTYKAVRFGNHTWPPFNPMLLSSCPDAS